MCQKLALELVLQWLGDTSLPTNKWMLHRDCYEEHLQCLTRLLATSKLDNASARDFVLKCWRALLTQYTMVLQCAHDNGFCTPIWNNTEKRRLKDLRAQGPKHALVSLQGALKWYPTEHQLIFQVGGGDPAAEVYLDYLEVKQNRFDSVAELSDPELSDDESYVESLSDRVASESDSGSEALSHASMSEAPTVIGEMRRYRDWVVMLNCQRWISATAMIQKCPGMRPFGGVLNTLCKDSEAFEKVWVDSWPMRWRVCVRLP